MLITSEILHIVEESNHKDKSEIHQANENVKKELLRLASAFSCDRVKLESLLNSFQIVISEERKKFLKKENFDDSYFSCHENNNYSSYENNEEYVMKVDNSKKVKYGKFKPFSLSTESIFAGLNVKCKSKMVLYKLLNSFQDIGHGEQAEIYFDEYQKIQKVIFSSIYNIDNRTFTSKSLFINSNFEGISFELKSTNDRRPSEQHYNLHNIDLKEIMSVINLKHSNNAQVYDLLPELFIPSAYDFNSDSFTNRLGLAQILEF